MSSCTTVSQTEPETSRRRLDYSMSVYVLLLLVRRHHARWPDCMVPVHVCVSSNNVQSVTANAREHLTGFLWRVFTEPSSRL